MSGQSVGSLTLLGTNTYGVQSAAEEYFGISADQVSVAQAASLVAIVQNPVKNGLNDPANYRANQARRNVILGFMKSEGYITSAQYEQAVKLYDALAVDGMAATLETSVHAQTLQAFARKRLEKGEVIDTEALGLYVGKVVKTPGDKKKGSMSDGD